MTPRRTIRQVPLALLLGCAVVTSAGVADAQPVTPDSSSDAAVEPVSERAGTLFAEGRELMKEGRFEEASLKLDESYKLEPRVGTILNLAVCHERVGMIATAWDEFQQARDAADAEVRTKQSELAQKRIDVLGPRVPWIEFLLPPDPPDGFALAIDGAPIDPDEWAAPIPIDPGEHIVVIAAPDHVPRELKFTIVERERKQLQLARLDLVVSKPQPAPHRPPPRPEPPPPKPPPPPVPKPSSDHQRWVLEVGAFGGFGLLHDSSPTPDDGGASIALVDGAGNSDTCAALNCSFAEEIFSTGVLGLGVFAGYAATEGFQVGGRGFAGVSLGSGLFFAAGPSLLFRVAGPFWLGGGAMLGVVSAKDRPLLRPPVGYTAAANMDTFEVTADTDVAPGPLLELSFQVVDWESGSLTFNATPMILFGKATALVVPIGAAFRFQ